MVPVGGHSHRDNNRYFWFEKDSERTVLPVERERGELLELSEELPSGSAS